MKRYLIFILLPLIMVSSGCLGFWTLVGTTVYLKTHQHETATVHLKSSADDIFQAMLRVVEKQNAEIIKADESKHLIEAKKEDGRFASVYVQEVKSDLRQMIVTVDRNIDQYTKEETALQIVNNVCAELGERCELSK